MKISDYIKHSLDACDARDLERAMLFACLAVDGSSRKAFPSIKRNGDRFRKFIVSQLDIIELMFGGLDLKETLFPFEIKKGIGAKFEDIIYEQFRCSLAHGDELPDGFSLTMRDGNALSFEIDITKKAMSMPESVIYALGLACVLSPVNSDQKIGSVGYHYRDPINVFVVDRWWGKAECARQIMDFDGQVKVKIDFSNVWPRSINGSE